MSKEYSTLLHGHLLKSAVIIIVKFHTRYTILISTCDANCRISRHCSRLQIPGFSGCCSASSTGTMERDGFDRGGDSDGP
jgi:hypothetical protein